MAQAGEPQGTLLAVRVWEVGKSECRAVMARIGVETSSHAKAGRLPTGLLVARRLTELACLIFFP